MSPEWITVALLGGALALAAVWLRMLQEARRLTARRDQAILKLIREGLDRSTMFTSFYDEAEGERDGRGGSQRTDTVSMPPPKGKRRRKGDVP